MLLLVIRLMWYGLNEEYIMGLVKTRRLAAMQKQQRAKAWMKPPAKKGGDMLSANRRDNGYGL